MPEARVHRELGYEEVVKCRCKQCCHFRANLVDVGRTVLLPGLPAGLWGFVLLPLPVLGRVESLGRHLGRCR